MVQVDVREVTRNLRAISDRKMPAIAAKALTRAAFNARDDLVNSMRSVFDRPTPFTLRSPIVIPADAGLQAPFSVVGFRSWAPKGVPAGRYLEPQIFGGMRARKRFEKKLRLRSNRGAVPGKWADLDQYGNWSAGQRNAALERIGVTNSSQPGYGRSQRGPKGKRKNEEYFLVPTGLKNGTLPPGIYRRGKEYGGAPLLVLAFVREPRYRQRFPMHTVIRNSVNRSLSREFARAFVNASIR